MRQHAITEWPAGLAHPVGVVELEPRELERRCGVHFSESYDDLDRLLGAIVETVHGGTFALVRHLGAGRRGTEVWVHEDSNNPRADLTTALDTLALDESALTWVSPAATSRGGQANSF